MPQRLSIELLEQSEQMCHGLERSVGERSLTIVDSVRDGVLLTAATAVCCFSARMGVP